MTLFPLHSKLISDQFYPSLFYWSLNNNNYWNSENWSQIRILPFCKSSPPLQVCTDISFSHHRKNILSQFYEMIMLSPERTDFYLRNTNAQDHKIIIWCKYISWISLVIYCTTDYRCTPAPHLSLRSHRRHFSVLHDDVINMAVQHVRTSVLSTQPVTHTHTEPWPHMLRIYILKRTVILMSRFHKMRRGLSVSHSDRKRGGAYSRPFLDCSSEVCMISHLLI